MLEIAQSIRSKLFWASHFIAILDLGYSMSMFRAETNAFYLRSWAIDVKCQKTGNFTGVYHFSRSDPEHSQWHTLRRQVTVYEFYLFSRFNQNWNYPSVWIMIRGYLKRLLLSLRFKKLGLPPTWMWIEIVTTELSICRYTTMSYAKLQAAVDYAVT